MVIKYSIDDLITIGGSVMIKMIAKRIKAPTPEQEDLQQEFLQFQQQLQLQSGHQIQIHREEPSHHEPLTSSVAEFFRKAQQNFYAETSIDPTKVRRLSEVEAELIERREPY